MRRSRIQQALRPALGSVLAGDASVPSLASSSPLPSAAAASPSCSPSSCTACTAAFASAATRRTRAACGLLPPREMQRRWQTAATTEPRAAPAAAPRGRGGGGAAADAGNDAHNGEAVKEETDGATAAPISSASSSRPATTAAEVEAAAAAGAECTPVVRRGGKKSKRRAAKAEAEKATPDAGAQHASTAQRRSTTAWRHRVKRTLQRLEAEQQARVDGTVSMDPKQPWRVAADAGPTAAAVAAAATPATATDTAAAALGGAIGFSDSMAELFVLDDKAFTERNSVAPPQRAEEHEEDDGSDGDAAPAESAGAAASSRAVEAPVDMDDSLMDDPFLIPSVDDDAHARDGGAESARPSAGASAALQRMGGGAVGTSAINESVLASVDLLCDDLFHCKTDVLRSFARTHGYHRRSKAETVLSLIEAAHRAAHGENKDLSLTRSVLGDIFDDSVRTSGVRSAWTNKSLEASHIELAVERHLNFQLMANSSKVLMVRNNIAEAARVVRKLTRMFLEEQEHISLVAVGGVFRTYRAEADELVRSLPATEIVSPFASLLVSYIRFGSSAVTLSRTDVNDHLVQMEVVQPTVQEVDDTTMLMRLMDMLDPAVQALEVRAAALRDAPITRFVLQHPHVFVGNARAFSEASHTRWNTAAAPDWAHDLARLFCNWEAIVRHDLPRFEEVPRYFFDCILRGAVDCYLLQRIYGEFANPQMTPMWVRRSLKAALMTHFNNEDNAMRALADLLDYVQAGSVVKSTAVRGEFFSLVLSQMQGAFQRVDEEERSALHDERVAVILSAVCDTASHCTRSHGLFPMLVALTADLHFHLRFQRIFKRLSTADRKVIRQSRSVRMEKTLDFFEAEHHIAPISPKAVGFLVVQLLYLALRGDGSKLPVLQRFASVTHEAALDVVGLTETKAPDVREMSVAFPPQLSYNSWLNESDTREKSVYSVLPSVAVKGSTNQAMIVSQAPMMKALDAISRVPWRINKYMLHVQEAIVREGFGFGKIRPGFYPLHYYALSDGSIRYPSDRRGAAGGGAAEDDAESGDDPDHVVFNLQQRQELQKQQRLDWKELSETRSARIHYLQALRQARSILQFSHLFFPNSMDFRGRMYPLPGRLNHTGSDPFRGLLEYADPKPLGSIGLYWLKVHLANKMGMSKLSFDERVHYVDEHIEDVVQSAESPLQGDRWWQEASEPLQCLMACKEVANALKHSQGPEKFLSRLPVAVDGSYNGLQHYSAIGRDEFGASLVNLLPSERPADAYTGILKEMLKSIHADAARDHQVAQRCLGTGKGQDTNHIKRKTIKRPIMTQVYGVTAFGMSEQIFAELQKQNKSHGLWTHTDMKEMSAYLRDKVLESLGVTFRETQNCRKWINDVVKLIWSVQPPELRNALCWTTPLGLVVRQPYKVRNECSLFTTNGYARIAGDPIAPASRKQLTAIAPNLIHSLDATHLAMTALEMQHQGLSMMAVHDSYWTYACDLPKLSQVLREQFVNLYSKYDPLWELKEQWEETYFMDLRRHGVKLPEPPKRGTLDLNQVLNSPYFFS